MTPTKMTKLNKSIEFDAGGGEASGSEDSDEDLLEQFAGSEFYTAGECSMQSVCDYCMYQCAYGEHVCVLCRHSHRHAQTMLVYGRFSVHDFECEG